MSCIVCRTVAWAKHFFDKKNKQEKPKGETLEEILKQLSTESSDIIDPKRIIVADMRITSMFVQEITPAHKDFALTQEQTAQAIECTMDILEDFTKYEWAFLVLMQKITFIRRLGGLQDDLNKAGNR